MGKQNDTDILRADDVIPPFNQKKEPQQKQSSNDETPAQKTNEIPKFDLAKQIMAQHRKNASTKRKAPKAAGQKTSSEYNGVQNVIERAFLSHQKRQSILQKPKEEKISSTPKSQYSPKASKGTIQYTQYGQRIISEIVATDIKKLIS